MLDKEIKKQLRLNRSKGLTIGELMDKFSLPKTTIWNNVHDVKLTDEQKKVIRSRQGGSTIRHAQDWVKAKSQARHLFDSRSKDRDWLPFFVALYWAEGTKGKFEFTNTDEDMLKMFIKFLVKHLRVDKEDIYLWVRVNSACNQAKIYEYWSSQLGVTTKNIKINIDDRHNKYRTQYGICRVCLKKSSYYIKLMHCLIDIFINDAIGNNRSRSSMDRVPHS